jgi:hypothetical protein
MRDNLDLSPCFRSVFAVFSQCFRSVFAVFSQCFRSVFAVFSQRHGSFSHLFPLFSALSCCGGCDFLLNV